MSTLELSINGKNYKASYIEYGRGDSVLLVYHGFGQKKEDYDSLTRLYPNHKLIVFDLYDHGESSSVRNHADLIELYLSTFDEVLRVKGLKEVSVLGFSIGTRIATVITSNRIKQIKELTLVAPDVSPEPLAFRILMRSPLRFLFFFFARFHWTLLGLLFLLKSILGSPFKFYYRLWEQKKYRRRLVNKWNGLRNSRKYIDWKTISRKLKVYTLRDEDMLNNDKIRFFYKSLNVTVEELPMSHYAFPRELKED